MAWMIRICLSLTLLVQLIITAACTIKSVSIGAARPNFPKTLIFRFVCLDDMVTLDRLYGQRLVLMSDDAKYVSTPITPKDLDAICTIADVPPGQYKLGFAVLSMSTDIAIPRRPRNDLSLEFRISRAGITVELLSDRSEN